MALSKGNKVAKYDSLESLYEDICSFQKRILNISQLSPADQEALLRINSSANTPLKMRQEEIFKCVAEENFFNEQHQILINQKILEKHQKKEEEDLKENYKKTTIFVAMINDHNFKEKELSRLELERERVLAEKERELAKEKERYLLLLEHLKHLYEGRDALIKIREQTCYQLTGIFNKVTNQLLASDLGRGDKININLFNERILAIPAQIANHELHPVDIRNKIKQMFKDSVIDPAILREKGVESLADHVADKYHNEIIAADWYRSIAIENTRILQCNVEIAICKSEITVKELGIKQREGEVSLLKGDFSYQPKPLRDPIFPEAKNDNSFNRHSSSGAELAVLSFSSDLSLASDLKEAKINRDNTLEDVKKLADELVEESQINIEDTEKRNEILKQEEIRNQKELDDIQNSLQISDNELNNNPPAPNF